jgi:hypothetical protein
MDKRGSYKEFQLKLRDTLLERKPKTPEEAIKILEESKVIVAISYVKPNKLTGGVKAVFGVLSGADDSPWFRVIIDFPIVESKDVIVMVVRR